MSKLLDRLHYISLRYLRASIVIQATIANQMKENGVINRETVIEENIIV